MHLSSVTVLHILLTSRELAAMSWEIINDSTSTMRRCTRVSFQYPSSILPVSIACPVIWRFHYCQVITATRRRGGFACTSTAKAMEYQACNRAIIERPP
ncbi:hypothetical protein P280DRAFT_321958 [Massarina eburnea CBS 473.64]|uniref:Secreted protein n=1 Tax=Massarina eburnea CBS 473.64 TaxID=1395130 RepID=A0A6A6RZ20_9PLEO|nr:hypothetical protein P280DRAFT_321958 [Massarina eburnea CBS 473.64]